MSDNMSDHIRPSVGRQASDSLTIPERRVVIKDPNELPADYSSTPGGTIFSTTPGGTRIIYDRRFLLQLRNSPLTKTPPARLPSIPDIINETTDSEAPSSPRTKHPEPNPPQVVEDHTEAELFSMDD